MLGVTAALVLAWRVSHVLFVIAVGFMVIVVALFLVARDGWRQTSPESLISRGIRPGQVLVMDPGLRREMASIIPAAVSRRISGNPPAQSPPEAAGLADGTKRCSRVPLSPSLTNGG